MSTPPMGQQPMPPEQPMQPPPYAPPPAPQQAPKKKRFGFLALGLAAVIGLILGGMIGAAGNGTSTTATAKPAPTVTVTSTAPAVVEGAGAPTEEPTEKPVSDTYEPKKSDFKIGVKTLQKECFGSAGCNVTFRIKPSYVGTQALPTTGEIEVSYKITGLEDPVENIFTVDGAGTITYTKEEDGSTSSKSDTLGAKVTDVEYTP